MNAIVAGLPEDVRISLEGILLDCLSCLEQAKEAAWLEWAQDVRTQFDRMDVQERIAYDLDGVRFNTGGPQMDGGGDIGEGTVPYVLLMKEFSAFRRKRVAAPPDVFGDYEHQMGVADIALGSLEKVVDGTPFGALLSVIRELVGLTKEVARRHKEMDKN